MIPLLSALGGATVAKLANGKNKNAVKESQLRAEAQGTQAALSKERKKRFHTERKVAQLQADADQAAQLLQQMQQEKERLKQQLEDLRAAPPHQPHRTASTAPPASAADVQLKADLQEQLRALYHENNTLKEHNAVLAQENKAAKDLAQQLQQQRVAVEQQEVQVAEARAHMRQKQQELEEKIASLQLEQAQVKEQAQRLQQVELQMQALKSSVAGVFQALASKQLSEQQALDQIRALGCEVHLVEQQPADQGGGSSSNGGAAPAQVVVQLADRAADSGSAGTSPVDATAFQTSFIMDDPSKLRRLLSNNLSRSSTMSSNDQSFRSLSFARSSSAGGQSLDLKLNAAASTAAAAAVAATPAAPGPQQEGAEAVAAESAPVKAAKSKARDKAGRVTMLADKPQQEEAAQPPTWSLKAALPTFLGGKTGSSFRSRTLASAPTGDTAHLTHPADALPPALPPPLASSGSRSQSLDLARPTSL